jgi:hypothetical protein
MGAFLETELLRVRERVSETDTDAPPGCAPAAYGSRPTRGSDGAFRLGSGSRSPIRFEARTAGRWDMARPPSVKDAKTPTGVREVELSPWVVDELRGYRAALGDVAWMPRCSQPMRARRCRSTLG